ncbi:MAG: fused response regulator/phosphatase [Holophaga sp.]|nr:fused response regulator/phosphatase [Holophaga sp.]
MQILVADDDPLLRAMALRVLESEGYEVLLAKDGVEALELFTQHVPDIVLTDYAMPNLNGLEVCRAIRAHPNDHYVAVVMLTGQATRELMQQSLDAGAIEFLTKPFEPEELKSRVRNLAELVRFHNRLVEQKARNDEEVSVVKYLLERYKAIGRTTMPNCFAMETLHTNRINGDICLYRQGLPGIHFGLICDATGNGLLAGVSTLPVAETFLGMVTKDIPLQVIYREINDKLRRILPADRFVCTLIFRINTHQNTLSIVNAGMPDAWLLRTDGTIRTFPSTQLPAGIQEVRTGEVSIVETSIAKGDRFLAFSDGLLDLFPPQYIRQHLLQDLLALPSQEHHQRIREKILEQLENLDPVDDISWALWEVPHPHIVTMEEFSPDIDPALLVAGLQVTFSFNPRYHTMRGMLPSVLSLLTNEGVDQDTTQLLALLLSEAMANAVDHGILGMDSTIKDIEGFEAYDEQRKTALASLAMGEVTVTLTLQHDRRPEHPLRQIDVAVKDSGTGFDWRTWLSKKNADSEQSHGRGLAILRALSSDFRFNDAGNGISFRVHCLMKSS